jgi:tRNA A37 threonylcarbamoyladenosine modification protein TsaB
VFTAVYRPAHAGVVRLVEYHVLRPDQLAAALEGRGEEVLLCGDGALAYREVFQRQDDRFHFGGRAHAMPSAGALVELALPRFQREEFSSPLDVTPLYLRRPDVDPSVERRLAGERGAGGA